MITNVFLLRNLTKVVPALIILPCFTRLKAALRGLYSLLSVFANISGIEYGRTGIAAALALFAAAAWRFPAVVIGWVVNSGATPYQKLSSKTIIASLSTASKKWGISISGRQSSRILHDLWAAA